jgi:hypothetical protein
VTALAQKGVAPPWGTPTLALPLTLPRKRERTAEVASTAPAPSDESNQP